MTRTKYRALVSVEHSGEITASSIKFSRNTAMEAGKSIIRDLQAGSWTIVRPEPWQSHLARPGHLVLVNDRDGRRAVIDAVEVA